MQYPLSTGALAATLLLATTALAESTGTDTTTGGHPACGRPHWLEAAVAFAAEGEQARYERYIDTGRCIETRAGMEITVLSRYGDADNHRVEIEFRGIRFFTVAEAVASSL